ncbi:MULTISPECIES: hypothetical protein [Aerococcus]|uniref:hypothetical protein n=1 Tax=Aerococcus urinae (strain CCUG 59500 / ACS-120-V-Col10a) TaxID=2976812 RepID=UPI00227AFD27|nr:hypothetical protein [Aerococcus sp. Group 1]MCY3031128.1 hypothetical protein [Aerococcus sp. Group 1]MCY3054236.1 hypothetical protein [Aerococcus sp. Group 1]MCY3055966.1 hypothetical protein [Aerococcus sp. Group 1]MCY3061888.1 hypothetical protein [Aerococcus sp. Group 1]
MVENDPLGPWSQEVLKQAQEESSEYGQRAYLAACHEAIEALDLRYQQASGRLDGLSWDKENW